MTNLKEATMRIPKFLAIVFCMGVFLLSSTLKADEWDKKTIFTFSGPVQVGKTQLAAGTYVFKLLDSPSDRHIVQIFNADETHIIATILAIPDYRLEPKGHTVVKFAESNNGTEASGNVPDNGIPIKEWFYPGDNFGQEFKVVPQPQVAEVQPPPVVEQPAPEPPVEAPAPAPEVAAPAPEEPPAQEAAPVQPEQTAPAPDQQSAPEQLPQTASQLPLVGVIGMLALAAAATLRIFLKVSA
jgi:outer membrane biosynthesis protein TonB